MPAAVRQGDSLATGHICDGSTTLSGHATDGTVVIEGSTAAVPGAPTPVHIVAKSNGACVIPHSHQLNAGSPNVFVNGKPLGRVGDSADAGAMTSGASTVWVNSAANPTFSTVPELDGLGNPTGNTIFSVIQPDGSTSYTVTY